MKRKKFEIAKKIIHYREPSGKTWEEHVGWIVINKKTGIPKGRTVYRKHNTAISVCKRCNQ